MEETVLAVFPDTTEIIRLAVISSAAAYGWTEWAHKILQQTRFDDGKYHVLWEGGIPVISVLLGAACGWWLGDWPWAAAIGAVAGGFNSAIVKGVKAYLRRKLSGNGSNEDPPEAPEDDADEELRGA